MIVLVVVIGMMIQFGESSITCISDSGDPIDWWIILKSPDGTQYTYMDDSSEDFSWSSFDLKDSGALFNTLQQVYKNSQSESVGYILYNDEDPDGGNHEDFGHTKGDVCFDSNSGFWLVHSAPQFPPPSSNSYEYSDSQAIFGQSFLCMTVDTSTFEGIGSQFLFNTPYVYDSNLPSSFNLPSISEVISGNFNTTPSNQTFSFQTSGGKSFTSFAKNGQWEGELYSGFVEPVLGTAMQWETWRNGPSQDNIPTLCTPQVPYDALNINAISLSSGQQWPTTKDHSKWGSAVQGSNEVCIGDINRQYSQDKRGGGTVCSSDSSIWESFNGIIAAADSC